MTYLDWAASAPPDPEALDEGRAVALELYANPSSPHGAGQRAAARLQQARARFAGVLGVDAAEIVFTSGGTEANTSLLLSLIDRHRLGGVERQKAGIVTTAIEHSSVYEQARALERHGFRTTVVMPGMDGRVDPRAVADAVREDTVMVSCMLVNNETGAIQDVGEMVRGVREASAHGGRKILFHTDAVQAMGKIPFSLRSLGVDAASFSAHKFGGPRGIGALYLRAGSAPGFLPLGGGQEAGRRPGTENLPGICSMTAAAEKRRSRAEAEASSARSLMKALVEGIRRIRGAWIFPSTREETDGRYSPWILLAGFPPLPGEVVVRVLDAAGFCIATGSACSSGKKDRTRVPESMGLPAETALSAVRISIGHGTTMADVEGLLAAMATQIPPLLSISRGGSKGRAT
jgi:cysteine desulfurase